MTPPELTTQRVCFLLHLRPERVDDYLTAHHVVWPEMLDALRDAGWRNYSLFLRSSDGLVVGYLETDDYARAVQAIADTDVNTRWQEQMAQYFASAADGDANPDTLRTELVEYLHLE